MPVEFVVQLQNRPGAFASLRRSLAKQGIDVRSVSHGGLGRLAYAVVATDEPDATREALRREGRSFSEGHPVIVEIEDRPGILGRVAERLARAGIDISGLTVVGRTDNMLELAIVTRDPAGARRALGLGEEVEAG